MLLDTARVAPSLGIPEEGQIWELCSYSPAKPLSACSLCGPQVRVHETHQVRQLRCSEVEELGLIRYFLWKQADGVHPTEARQADSNVAALLRNNQGLKSPMRKGGQKRQKTHGPGPTRRNT